jgi:hypothetical protein
MTNLNKSAIGTGQQGNFFFLHYRKRNYTLPKNTKFQAAVIPKIRFWQREKKREREREIKGYIQKFY